MLPGNRVIRDKLGVYVRARYLRDADSPAREKHARLIASETTVELALKRSQCCERRLRSREVESRVANPGETSSDLLIFVSF